MRGQTFWTFGIAAALAAGFVACGGGSTPTGPSGDGGGSGGGSGGSGTIATITITAAGVASPRDVTIPPGGRVTFVNNHSAPHDMASDPHPEHTACPPLNQVGFLQPGQSRTSGNLNTPGTCGYHDHINPNNTGLTGTIRIQ